MEQRPVNRSVAHVLDGDVGAPLPGGLHHLAELEAGTLGVDARGRRLVEALGGAEPVVCHLERAGVVPVVLARRPVGFVRDHQMHFGKPVLLLSHADAVQRLVSGEDGHHAVLDAVQTAREIADFLRDDGGIGGDRRLDFRYEAREAGSRAACALVLVRAHHHRAHWALGVLQPRPPRLASERDARRGVDHDGASRSDLFSDSKRNQRLAGAAGHDQLAPILRAELVHASPPSGLLVVVECQRLAAPQLGGGQIAPLGLGVDQRSVRIVRVGGHRPAPFARRHHPIDRQLAVALGLEPELLEIVQHEASVRVQAFGLDGDQPAIVPLGEDVHARVGQIGQRPPERPASQRGGGIVPSPSAGDFGGWNLRKRLNQPTLEPIAFVGTFV